MTPRTLVIAGGDGTLNEVATGPLEVDGDPVGTLPVRVEIVPAALSVLGPTP